MFFQLKLCFEYSVDNGSHRRAYFIRLCAFVSFPAVIVLLWFVMYVFVVWFYGFSVVRMLRIFLLSWLPFPRVLFLVKKCCWIQVEFALVSQNSWELELKSRNIVCSVRQEMEFEFKWIPTKSHVEWNSEILPKNTHTVSYLVCVPGGGGVAGSVSWEVLWRIPVP